jgi:hypothetical protein
LATWLAQSTFLGGKMRISMPGFIVVSLLLVSCSVDESFQKGDHQLPAPSGSNLDEAYFENEVLPVLDAKCVMCHSNYAPTYEAASSLVVFGDPDNSDLYTKGEAMGLYGDGLQTLKNWIMGATK